MNKLLKSYNTDATILVITSYPNPENGKYGKREFNAIGEHAERRLPYLAQQGKILVAAEKSGSVKQFQATQNLLIHRIWEKGNYASFWRLFLFILKNNKIRSIFVQFEFNVFGGIIPNLLMILMLTLLRISGKKVTFELHQVIMDVGKLYKHVPIKTRALQLFVNVFLRIFYVALGLICSQIVVFEQDLKLRLEAFIPEHKIHVLCLSIVKKDMPRKSNARKKLRLSLKEFIVLQFGFINGYKGIDWATSALSDINKGNVPQQVRYLVAGGANPYLKNQLYYKAFLKKITAGIQKYTHMNYTGFIPEDHIKDYFAAADLVILPYEVFMSASGPFSQTLAHGKPLLLSDALLSYAKSPDFRSSMSEANLYKDDLFFARNKKEFQVMIKRAQKSKAYRTRLQTFSLALQEKRSSINVMRHLYSLLVPSEKLVSSYAPTLMVQS